MKTKVNMHKTKNGVEFNFTGLSDWDNLHKIEEIVKFNCDCSETGRYNAPDGTYIIDLKVYNIEFSLIYDAMKGNYFWLSNDESNKHNNISIIANIAKKTVEVMSK